MPSPLTDFERIDVSLPRRYLVPCDFNRLPHLFTDVLVVGTGAAGLRAAIEVAERGRDVVLLSKGSVTDSATRKAQGGIAVSFPEAGGVEGHVEDTLRVGDGLCDEESVREIVSRSEEVFRELVEWGAVFDTEGGGRVALTREGGHSVPRIAHARGDATGLEIHRCLLERCMKRSDRIYLMEECFLVDLICMDGECFGALVRDRMREMKVVRAGAVILAAGGCGRVYRETTNPTVCTGDGLACALRAGLPLCGMEFVQFHPTTLYVAGAARFLISEVLRGEGGILVDKNGRRFMFDYHPDGELAPRDVVSLAVFRQMKKTSHPNVYLDVSHLSPRLIEERFPEIAAVCRSFGIDISKEPIPVRPSAHYMVGGVVTDAFGRTEVEGLFVCGENAYTGLHGANRMGSNSLLEALVTGREAGMLACGVSRKRNRTALPRVNDGVADMPRLDGGLDMSDVRNSLASTMMRMVGIERNEDEMGEALRMIERWCSYAMSGYFTDPAGWELQNMLLVGRVITGAALWRKESRGAHYRTDFPEKSDYYGSRHLQVRGA